MHLEQRLRRPEVEALTGLSKTRIYAKMQAGTFPPPERDGKRCARWRYGDVLAWLSARREPAQ
jgi:prophage regulatory protein